MAYAKLENEDNTSVIFNNQPKWMKFAAFAGAVLIVAACAVNFGIVVGCSYSLFLNHSALKSVSGAAEHKFNMMKLFKPNFLSFGNKTITGAFAKSTLFSKILKSFRKTLTNEMTKCQSWKIEYLYSSPTK
ncbi:hypothetical protein O0L34_g6162 [Tuta absoluta]|nr:hypothetical protein O0L34_g6162 [Tuta absoluta]